MNLLKETILDSKKFTAASDVYLEAGHICVRKEVAEKIFGRVDMALSVFYPRDSTFMAAPADEQVFNTIHKGSHQLLKSKNTAGDKSISIQELILDNEIDPADRNLEFEIEDALHILKVKL